MLHVRRRLVVAVASLALVGVWLLAGPRAGVAAGVSPVALLGQPCDVSTCTTVPQPHGHGILAFCRDFSATIIDGTVQAVSLYAPGASSVVAGYVDPLPLGLRWQQPLVDVAEALGKPARISAMYRTPTLVYMFGDQVFGSVELQFDEADALVRVNASITR
jgi:hypothetical protein